MSGEEGLGGAVQLVRLETSLAQAHPRREVFGKDLEPPREARRGLRGSTELEELGAEEEVGPGARRRRANGRAKQGLVVGHSPVRRTERPHARQSISAIPHPAPSAQPLDRERGEQRGPEHRDVDESLREDRPQGKGNVEDAGERKEETERPQPGDPASANRKGDERRDHAGAGDDAEVGASGQSEGVEGVVRGERDRPDDAVRVLEDQYRGRHDPRCETRFRERIVEDVNLASGDAEPTQHHDSQREIARRSDESSEGNPAGEEGEVGDEQREGEDPALLGAQRQEYEHPHGDGTPGAYV